MLYEGIIEGVGKNSIYATDSIQKLNQQLADNYNSKIETLEKELLSLSDLLVIDGNLLAELN